MICSLVFCFVFLNKYMPALERIKIDYITEVGRRIYPQIVQY